MKSAAIEKRRGSIGNGHARTLGPRDHGRAISEKAALRASYLPGYKYELIDGKLFVSPKADMPHDDIVTWLYDLLRDYQRNHPEVVKRVSCNARVHIPGFKRTTTPEPDLALYDRLAKSSLWTGSWQAVSPFLVVEVTDTDIDKDFVRNVRLYEQVPCILEYWIIHYGQDEDTFFFRPYTKRGTRWSKDVPTLGYGSWYQTGRLPGLKLKLEPR